MMSIKLWGLFGGVSRLLLLAFFLVRFFSPASAQTFSHPLSPQGGDFFFEAKVIPDTVQLLAIMVQFQADTDSRTTGDGRFELFTGKPDSVIDAPPHDRAYFRNHLKFLENYYAKVSDGRLILKTEVLDQVITLSKQMQTYSPQKTDDYGPFATLIEESWRKADSLMPATDFSRYQSFVIFHAGAGRDINLQQLYGFDPTPFDIPSVYLGLRVLRGVFGANYKGVPVNGGRAFVTNSMLIPETENRLLAGVSGPALLELSINGLLAASLGSFLGLPDLFDTKMGSSGIGRLGLMDGQAIFSFNGLFPPEPSAWEKIYLGWVTPVVVPPGSSTFTARAVGFHDGSPSTIYKVPINAREYFLVENRNRDPGRNGQRVKSMVTGQLVEKQFARDTASFNATDTRAIRGVVIEVEDYDWSLPGGVDQRGTFFDGGILIWHIDENVIETNYSSNTVNANPNHRGVDLEEADGSQDIGQIYDITQAGSGSESGTALDFWFKGNSSPVNKNAFTPTTNPNSLSYSLANSHVYITDFSERGPTMTFKVQLGDEIVLPLKGFPKFLGGSGPVGAPIAQRAGCPLVCNYFFITAHRNLYGYRLDGTTLTKDTSGIFDTRGATNQPALTYFCSPILASNYVVGVSDSSVFVWADRDVDNNARGDLLFTRSVGHRITTSPVVFMDGPRFITMVGDMDGGVSTVSVDSLKRSSFSQQPIRDVLNVEGRWIAVAADKAVSQDGSVWDFAGENAFYAASGDLDGDGVPEVVVFTGSYHVLVFNRTSPLVRSFSAPFSDGNLSQPAIGDIDGDGKKEIVLARGNRLLALNSSGYPIDYFPIELPASAGISTAVVLAKLGTETSLTLFVGTSNGLVYGYDARGRVLRGFPLSAGGAVAVSLALFQESDYLGILAATSNGYLYAWSLPQTSKTIIWGNTFGDPLHSGFENSPATVQPRTTEFFPTDRVYNWPNPVYGGSTQIRYFLKTSADVKVKIFDLAGDKVAEMSGPGIGGIDNEVKWDVSNVQSGLYIARIEANGSGERGVALVKIAVVK